MSETTVQPWMARVLVFGSSAAVLVLEILAGRMLAPFVGVSLETFTGIIGTVLAGIAVGAWAGGELADYRDPRTMIGPSLVLGGVLSWLALPIVRSLGPEFGSGALSIIILTTAAFFAPAAVLTAVSPMVAKLRLTDLDQTGAVVGGLSAAGTLGALAGTFITGFVLVAALPTRPTVMLVGGVLVASGVVTHWMLTRQPPAAIPAMLVLLTGGMGAITPPACDYETGYACVNIVADPDAEGGRSMIIGRSRQAYVDLNDPLVLDLRYSRIFAQIIEATPDGPIDSLHVGGGGFSLPRYLEAVRPGSAALVLEIDAELVDIAEAELGLVRTDRLEVRTGDARLGLDDLADDSYDMVAGDAFADASVPWHLTTQEFLEEVDRVLRPDGLYLMNVIDGNQSRFSRAELATLREIFAHVAVVLPLDGVPADYAVNQVLVASQAPLPEVMLDPEEGRLLSPQETIDFIDGAEPLRDDFAPADQLSFG